MLFLAEVIGKLQSYISDFGSKSDYRAVRLHMLKKAACAEHGGRSDCCKEIRFAFYQVFVLFYLLQIIPIGKAFVTNAHYNHNSPQFDIELEYSFVELEGKSVWRNIEERVLCCAEYIVETGCTVRACAQYLSSSKSTVHKDVTERLAVIDPVLWEKVKAVLDVNLKERHLRGGDATKRKYAASHNQTKQEND